jgi:hypothetical protein
MFLREYKIMQTGRYDLDQAVNEITHSNNPCRGGSYDRSVTCNIIVPMTEEEIKALNKPFNDNKYLIELS